MPKRKNVSYPIIKEESVSSEPVKIKAGYIREYLKGNLVKSNPEEIVRQEYVKRLVEEYGYPKENIATEVPIQMGRDETKRADIVIYKNDKKLYDEIYVIVECKAKDKSEGEKQAKSYGSVTTTSIVIWHNGTDTLYWERLRKPHQYNPRGYLPKYGQFYGDKKILKSDLRPASNLIETFKRIHNNVYANAPSGNKGKVFYEIIYVLFAKLQDEKSYSKECQFILYDREWDEVQDKGDSKSFRERILGLFEEVKNIKEYSTVFDGDEKITLPIPQIAYIVSEMEYISILHTDVKGDAFQTFLSSYFRGDAGQFFTPDPIKKLTVEMLDPQPNEVVLDPACGSSGFLVFTINHYRDFIKKQRKWLKDDKPLPDYELSEEQRELLRKEIRETARDHIRGIDFDNDLTKVAKMYMVMVDDGHTGIHTANALLPFIEFNKIMEKQKGDIAKECADIIMTNPPFGSKGKVSSKEILSEFDFGYQWKKDQKTNKFEKAKLLSNKGKNSGQVPDILFIERCIHFLKPNGRMAIVLPDGDLTNQNTEFMRAWLKERVQIVAVISLPPETFIPYGAGVKSSVLFIKKPKNGKLPEKYPIFFGVIEKIGYDIRGRRVYKRNEKGEILDMGGKVIFQDDETIQKQGAIDTDVTVVLDNWEKFKKEFKRFLW